MLQRKAINLNAFSYLLLNLLIFTSAEIVEIEDGQLDGTVMTTRKNVNFHAFLNIPYAQPPIGYLRFQAPVPNNKWGGVRIAKEFGPMCMQAKRQFNVSEDCLHLNVFTKNLNSSYPVIVFIHGGSFEEGSALNHQPLYLLDRDIVLVTINYRFGPFGFLSTGTVDAIGNMGLKDQNLALKWVQKNIEKFGGDPTRVTIAGLSAGGYSVTAHMASEMSQGLFRRVIAVSGAITSFGKLEDNYIHLVEHIAAKLNCTSNNVTAMVSCLQWKPAESILAVDITQAVECRYAMVWLPVIEKDFGQERFFARHPFETFQDPKVYKTPIMLGFTEHEMHYMVPIVLSDPQFVRRMKENFHSLTAACFYLENYSNESTLFRNVYLPLDDIDQRSFNNLGNLFGDGSISYGVHRLVQMISTCTDVYYYKFTYVGRYSVFNYPRQFPYGVTHADDLQYVLYSWYIGPSIELTDPENIMVERMTRIWERFAATGSPENANDPYLADMRWPKHDENHHYLEIGTHLVEKRGLALERFNAFDDLIRSTSHKMKAFNFSLLFTLIFIVTRLV